MAHRNDDTVSAQLEAEHEQWEEDVAFLEHVFDDEDRPPQGLHQQGYQPASDEGINRSFDAYR